MEVAISLVLGILLGTAVSVFNHLLLLNGMRKLTNENTQRDTNTISKIYLIRYVINLVVLILVFVFREKLPFSWDWILIGTAVGLTLPARIFAMKWGVKKPAAAKDGEVSNK